MSETPAPNTDVCVDDNESEIARLRAQCAEIAQIAGGLAHEIRNPLSIMRLNLDLLAEDLRDAESHRDRRALQKIDRVKGECYRLEDLLEDFLRFARVQTADTEPHDLNSVIDELRDFFEGQAAAQHIVLREQSAENLPVVPLDVDLFKQAVLNLLVNAQQAMPNGGELILTTRRDGDFVVFEVVDTGVGIPPEIQSRVFDAFFSTRKGGTGLGLPTTRKIIQAHGGTISLESSPGMGSKFTIHLPIQKG
jgi:two-component system, NtrC family, sensor histidine kinase HydH